MKYPLADELLLIQRSAPFLMVAKARSRFSLCIETPDGEYCEAVAPEDLVVVSAPEGGDPEPAAMLVLLVRDHHCPLLVLPKDHPGSGRLKYVVACGPVVQTSCTIRRGTHPEQHLICSAGDFADIRLQGVAGGVDCQNLPPGTSVTFLRPRFSLRGFT